MTHPMLDLSAWEDVTPDPSLVIADGSLVKVDVRDGCLVVTDGPKGQRVRTYTKPRRARTIKHLMILGSHGYVTLAAFRWLADTDTKWTVIDQDGRVIHDLKAPRMCGTSGGYVDSMLERRQAFASAGGPMADRGLVIIQRFMASKLRGQAWNAEFKLGDANIAKYINERLADILASNDLKEIMGLEGQAAAAYWSLWKGLAPSWCKPFPTKKHWLAYPGRASLNYDDDKNRNATDPVNALLNWAYKVAETECTLALYSVALSPTMGISHVDLASHRRRNAFALDLMEGMRPIVDEIVLSVIRQPLDRRLFTEDATGIVTIEAPLTHAVAARVHEVAYKMIPDVQAALMILTANP